jgi:hypothetical protein
MSFLRNVALLTALVTATPVLAQPAAPAAPPAAASTLAVVGDAWTVTVQVAEEVLEVILHPVRELWAALTDFFIDTQAARRAARAEFRATLADDRARFDEFAKLAGVHLTRVGIETELHPQIVLAFTRTHVPTEAERAALHVRLAELHGLVGTVERAVLSILLNLGERAERLRPHRFRLSEVEMTLVDLPPRVMLLYEREPEQRAERP